MRTMRSSLEKTEEKLKETERQLASAQAENCSLKNQVHIQHNTIIIIQTHHATDILIPWYFGLHLFTLVLIERLLHY